MAAALRARFAGKASAHLGQHGQTSLCNRRDAGLFLDDPAGADVE